MSDKIVICYMCGLDWDYHLGEDVKGTKLYPSEKSLIDNEGKSHIEECGIVKVEVRLSEIIQEQNLFRGD